MAPLAARIKNCVPAALLAMNAWPGDARPPLRRPALARYLHFLQHDERQSPAVPSDVAGR